MTGTTNDQTATFAYNPADQIASNTRNNDGYAWTGHGSGSLPATINGLNQIAFSGGSFAHDARGNTTFDAANRSYAYSGENLLISSSASGTPSVSLGYDPLNRPIQVGAAATTRFAYDGAEMIGEYDGANNLIRRFVFGPGTDEPLVQYGGSGTGEKRWFHADERGSIIGLSEADGGLATALAYDEYGKPKSTNASRFQYTGQMWLPEIGVYNYKARMENSDRWYTSVPAENL